MNAADCVIWSADVSGDEAVLWFLTQVPGLKKVKLDRNYVERYGWGLFTELPRIGVDVFDDGKPGEVPTKLEEIARNHTGLVSGAAPWMSNCMAGSTSTREQIDPKTLDGLKRFANVCHAAGTRPCGVTVLTSKTEAVVADEFNGRTAVDQVLWYVGVLLQCGFTDVVCSPLEAAAIRAESAFDMLDLNTPGIRLAESDVRDQARTNTPYGAMKNGATRLVIGSDLTDAADPLTNFRRIVAEIEAAQAA